MARREDVGWIYYYCGVTLLAVAAILVAGHELFGTILCRRRHLDSS